MRRYYYVSWIAAICLAASLEAKASGHRSSYSAGEDDSPLKSFCVRFSPHTQYTLVYFFPNALCQNLCMRQALSIRALNEEYREIGVAVIGITDDEPAYVGQFIKRLNLSFPILSDSSQKLMKLFGVPCVYPGRSDPERFAFLLKKGEILKTYYNINVDTFATDVVADVIRFSSR